MTFDAATTEMLDTLDRMGWTTQQRDEALSLLAVAHERGDEDLEFAVRMRLTAYGVMKDATDLALANFAWCSAKHKEDPARFYGSDSESSDTIFWHYKWMPGIITRSPVFDLNQLEDVLNDFEATYRAAGLPLSAVVTARLESATRTGKLAEAEAAAAVLTDMPRDDYSSCLACVPSDFVNLELLRGNAEGAVKIAVDTWRSHESCAEEPESMLGDVLIHMLRVGHPDAVEAFQVAYDSSRHRDQMVGTVSQAASFAAVTGNHDLAFQIVERHLTWLAHDALGESEHFVALYNFAIALDHFAAAKPELANATVRGSADPRLAALLPPTDRNLTIGELSAALWATAAHIGSQFDARNGNDIFAQELADARAQVGESYPHELEGYAEFAPISVRPSVPQSGSEWVIRAIEAIWAADYEGAFSAARMALAEGDALNDAERARVARVLKSAAENLDDPQLTASLSAEYVTIVREVRGEDAAALAAAEVPGASAVDFEAALAAYPDAHGEQRARGHMLASQALLSQPDGPSDEDVERAGAHIQSAAELLPADETFSRSSVLFSRAQYLFATGQQEAAFADLDEAAEIATSRVVDAAVLQLRGYFLGRLEEPAAAAAAFDESATLFAAAGFEGAAMRRALQSAEAWKDAGDADQAVARFDFALSLAPADANLPVQLRWDYAGVLLDAEQPGRAVPLLEEILGGELEQGNVPPGSLAHTHFRLARAYDGSYDERAGEHYTRASELFAADEAWGAAAEATLYAGRELSYQEDFDAAVAVLEAGRGYEARQPDPFIEYELFISLAPALAEVGRDDWRQAIDHGVEVARGLDDPQRLLRALTRRISLFQHSDPAAALTYGEEVIEFALANQRPDEAVGVLWVAAGTAAERQGPDAGVEWLQRYRARASEFGVAVEDLSDMGSSLLESWGREAEAQRWVASLENEG